MPYYSEYAWVVPLNNKRDTSVSIIHFKYIKISLIVAKLSPKDGTQTKHGQLEVVNFKTDQWNHGYKIMKQKCIQPIMTEILLLMRELLDL